jgi:uncharacterized protein (DUF58 family)
MKGIRQTSDSRPIERELNVKLLPGLVVIFGILYLLTGFRGWLVFFIGMLGLWLLAVLWINALEHSLSIERRIHLAWATVGESVPEELRVINKSRLPALWVEIVDEAETLDTPIRLVSDVESNASRRRHPVHLFAARLLHPTPRLRTSDPFGIYTLTLHDQHSSSILVMPPFPDSTQACRWLGGDRQRRRGAPGTRSAGRRRNYLPGDSLRRIHWRASAHSNSLMVRRLDAATSDDWRIFVDLNAAVQAGVGQDSTLELAIVLADSLATRGWKERRRVGLALVGPKLVWLEPRSDPAHRWQILQVLAMAKTGQRSLADLMALSSPTRTATSIIITPTTDPSCIAAARPSQTGNSMITLLIDPNEFGRTTDQSKIVSVLTRNRISFAHMPRSLLEEAYPFLASGDRRPPTSVETGSAICNTKRVMAEHELNHTPWVHSPGSNRLRILAVLGLLLLLLKRGCCRHNDHWSIRIGSHSGALCSSDFY